MRCFSIMSGEGYVAEEAWPLPIMTNAREHAKKFPLKDALQIQKAMRQVKLQAVLVLES